VKRQNSALRKVLIVTPNWPPVSCPDLHRVRVALPHFAEFGWEPLILRVDPDEQEGLKDEQLALTIPRDIKVWQAGCVSKRLTEWIGLRNVGLRSLFHLAKMGDAIIERERPTVVFFSTTMFPVMAIGRYWLKRHGIPYVLDFQDPWLSDYRRPARSSIGSAKYGLSQQLAKILEPFALRKVAHVIAVSPAYVTMLRARYGWLHEDMLTVLPFGASQADFEVLTNADIRQKQFDPRDGKMHWVYVGRGGNDMAFSLRAFFHALNQAAKKDPTLRHTLRIHFIGTDYAPSSAGIRTIEPLAIAAGVREMISEEPARLPYFEALRCLEDADALIVPGSDDPGYTASKIYPYVLAGKPLLAIFNELSNVVDFLKKTGAGIVVTFKPNDDLRGIAATISSSWFDRTPTLPTVDWVSFQAYTAEAMTKKLCSVFDRL